MAGKKDNGLLLLFQILQKEQCKDKKGHHERARRSTRHMVGSVRV